MNDTVPLDDEALPAAAGGWKRGSLKAFIAARYNTRVHMSLILACCGLTAMVSSATLLHYGVHSMLVRYPLSMGLAYVTFLLGVWTWLRATGLLVGTAVLAQAVSAKRSKSRWLDIPGVGGGGGGSSGGSGGGGPTIPRGGGGTFDGGGASSSFAGGRAPVALAGMEQPDAAAIPAASSSRETSSISSSSSKGSSLLDGIDGDGVVLLVLAGVLVFVVFATSGYLIWCAPDVLTEAAFGAALTGTLSRASTEHAAGGWVGGVVRKTWWPFALVMVAVLAFAGWSATHYPEAHTFRQAIASAIHSQEN